MCKHVAATLYGVGTRLDGKPELFFTLRGADMQELITAASSNAASAAGSAPATDGLDASDLSAIFGVEIEMAAAPVPACKLPARKKAPAKKAAVPVMKKPAARNGTRKA